MEGKKQRAIVIDDYGKEPYVSEEWPVPTLKQGELLVKVQASTINPSDRIFLSGGYFKRPLPSICGIEGTGVVVEANGEALQSWVGKRVVFISGIGSWCQYAVTTPLTAFQIDQDVPLTSACSGIVNPLTVIGFVENWRKLGAKGIIHTAAASSLGKMLVKICLRQNIPLLNIVRKEEQAETLRNLGATDIIITQNDWQKQLKSAIENKGFDCVYDALGGGPVTDAIISSIGGHGVYHLYGKLQKQPFLISNAMVLFSGTKITGFMMMGWWAPTTAEVKEKVRKEYSDHLKKELSTKVYKTVGLKEILEGLKLSVDKANEGKIMISLQ